MKILINANTGRALFNERDNCLYGRLNDNSLLIELSESGETIEYYLGQQFDSYLYVGDNKYIVTKEGNDWSQLFRSQNTTLATYLVKVINTGDLSNVTNMQTMFEGCTNLVYCFLNRTYNVTNMRGLFYNCSSLASVQINNTQKVENMYEMFYNCTSLTAIPKLNTEHVTNVYGLFLNCIHVQTGMLDFYEDVISKSIMVTSFTRCFTSCGILGGATAATERAQIPVEWGGDLED